MGISTFLLILHLSSALVGLLAASGPPLVEGQDHVTGEQRLQVLKRSTNEVSDHSRMVAGYLLSHKTDSLLNLSNPIDANLSDVLNRNGPDMRPSRNYRDFQDISMEVSKRAWVLLHEQTSVSLRRRIELAWPALEEILFVSRVSNKCLNSIKLVMEGAKRMESWAVKLLNSWGSFPMSGLFEGTYGDVGSFQTCVDIKNNKYIDHAHYCSVTFRPVMPRRRDYELVVRHESRELLDLFENQNKARGDVSVVHFTNSTDDAATNKNHLRDAFTDILEHAQYHHYVYYKWGTCWPIQCSPFDVKRVVRQVGRRNILMNGPVKCYSRNEHDYEQADSVEVANGTDREAAHRNTTRAGSRKLIISIWDMNDGIFIWKPHFNPFQKVALTVLLITSSFIITMTSIDIALVRVPALLIKLKLAIRALPLNSTSPTRQATLSFDARPTSFSYCATGGAVKQHHSPRVGFSMVPTDLIGGDHFETSASRAATDGEQDEEEANELSAFMQLVDDCSIITNAKSFFRVSESQLKSDILCLNGLRCITMVWILMTHTMMYNDWSAFARTRDVEKALNSLINQPLFNGSYLVDTFFLMSGLLSAFTAFKHCQAVWAKFNSIAYIFGRWLRLTPQIFLVSMIYIVLPAASYGPHWYPVVAEYSENCIANWWINVLHLQAFYKTDRMCNFVTWWISIDFFYHFFALATIWITILAGHRYGFLSMSSIVLGGLTWQCIRHYEKALPPNVFSTIPQTGAMWTTMTLEFFWTPYTHVVPFFFGFYTGYLMSLKRKLILRELNTRRALIGWSLSLILLSLQGYSTYWWVTGQANYSRSVSTIFYTACAIVWSSSICWIIIACHHGYGGFIDRLLSARVFIILGKASYMVYLSHFQIMFLFYGNQNILIEPAPLTMLYIILGNILLSTLYGITLCIVYELPWLKFHRRLMKYV